MSSWEAIPILQIHILFLSQIDLASILLKTFSKKFERSNHNPDGQRGTEILTESFSLDSN